MGTGLSFLLVAVEMKSAALVAEVFKKKGID